MSAAHNKRLRCPECGFEGYMLLPEHRDAVRRAYMREYMRGRRAKQTGRRKPHIRVHEVLAEIIARAFVNGLPR